MTPVPVTTPDLPVIWWAFWLIVMAVGIFGLLAWWLTRAALREDSAPREDHEHERAHGILGEDDPDGTRG